MRERHIFAIGDNGFRSDPTQTTLYELLLQTTGKPRPRVLFIPTASGDAADYIEAFKKLFEGLQAWVSVLSLFRGEEPDFAKLILSQDLIYVGGGNTRNMLILWKNWGIDTLIRQAYDQGAILAGGSAGSLCWFQGGVTDSIPGRFSSLECLAYLNFSNCPHYNELTRRPYYLSAVQSGELGPGYAAENGVALHFVNENFKEALSMVPDRAAYFLKCESGTVDETKFEARVLGPTERAPSK